MKKAFAPGKLILSGEHAVVYGKPALAMAVNRHITAEVVPQISDTLVVELLDLSHHSRIKMADLPSLCDRLTQQYQHFMAGKVGIRDILQHPVELIQFAVSLFVDTFSLPSDGLHVRLQSTLPIGCGMGSSAAVILSILYVLAEHFCIEKTEDTFFRLALEAENMQHGRSSGLDLRVSLQGGCWYVKNAELIPRSLPLMPMMLVNTGVPATTTGECVAAVSHYFQKGQLANDFADVTQAFDAALQQNNFNHMLEVVKENHLLLTQIGVVPHRVQEFIAELEWLGAAAKICGAGAVAGERAGVVLVFAKEMTAVKKICEKYHCDLLTIAGEMRGAHVI